LKYYFTVAKKNHSIKPEPITKALTGQQRGGSRTRQLMQRNCCPCSPVTTPNERTRRGSARTVGTGHYQKAPPGCRRCTVLQLTGEHRSYRCPDQLKRASEGERSKQQRRGPHSTHSNEMAITAWASTARLSGMARARLGARKRARSVLCCWRSAAARSCEEDTGQTGLYARRRSTPVLLGPRDSAGD
jgi:hypothetical protein